MNPGTGELLTDENWKNLKRAYPAAAAEFRPMTPVEAKKAVCKEKDCNNFRQHGSSRCLKHSN